ncbi:hypothetical protein PS15p_210054 [Mucor circinelloides]
MESITKSLPAHQKHNQNLKEEAYGVIGCFVRKSPTVTDDATRITPLKAMYNRLSSRLYLRVCI